MARGVADTYINKYWKNQNESPNNNKYNKDYRRSKSVIISGD